MPQLSESDARVSERFAVTCRPFANEKAAGLLGNFKVALEHEHLEHEGEEKRIFKPLQARLDEYTQLVQEVEHEYGIESAKYLKAHISAAIEKHFSDAARAANTPDQTLRNFFRDSLFLRVSNCALADDVPTRDEPTAADVARDEFLKKGQDTVDHVVFRVKEFEGHWVNAKRAIPPINTINQRMHQEMLIATSEGIEFNG